MNRPLTLLLLSGGGHTGANIMSTLAGRRAGLRLIATSDTASEPTLYTFDAVYLAPRLAECAGEFERRFVEIVEREAPDLVVPCRDEDIHWLAGFGARRPDLRDRFLCGAPAIAEVINDKWLSYRFCEDHDLPFAASYLCSDDAAARAGVDAFVDVHGLPVVAKPRQGVDSKDIVLLTSRAQVRGAMQRQGFVLQRYLGNPAEVQDYLAGVARDGVPLFHTFQGIKRSLQMVIGPTGAIEYLVCTRNRMTGRCARSVAMDDDPAALLVGTRCASVFAAAGWRGPLNVQCQPDPSGALVIHEFNGRFTGATSARWQLGVDEVGNAIRAFTGTRIGSPFPADTVWPREVFEGLAARAAAPACTAALAAAGEWGARPR